MISKHDLDTIDFRADKEIYEIWFSAVMTKERIQKKRVSAKLRKKLAESFKKFSEYCPDDCIIAVEASLPRIKGTNDLDTKGVARCSARFVSRSEISKRGFKDLYEDDDDDDEDDDD